MKTRIHYLPCATIAALAGQVVSAADLAVDLSTAIRPVTHAASGSLYGITETLPSDIDAMVAPLKQRALTNPALAGSGRQQPIGAAIPVAKRVASVGTRVQIRLADVLPGWPYKWAGQSSWTNEIKNVISAKKAANLTNWDGYEIWNEPDGTWQSGNGDFNTVCWKAGYDVLKAQDPDMRIIGPSISYYQSSYMKNFLTYAKANNCLPDVVSWHQWGSGGFVASLENYRALEKSLGITPRAISINEYSSKTSDPYEGCPGYAVPFIAKFERHGVESAMISWWWVSLPGRMGSLLTSGNQKGGGWHLYKWYGDMSGDMVKVTPPNDKSDGVDGFAAIDAAKSFASVVVGGNTTGTTNVKISGFPAWFGTSVNVKVEQVTWTNKDQAVSGPTTLSDTKYTIANGAISVPVQIANAFYGYRVSLTPTVPSGILSKDVAASSGAVRVYDPRGGLLGEVDPGERRLEDALAQAFPQASVVLVREGTQARKIVLGAR